MSTATRAMQIEHLSKSAALGSIAIIGDICLDIIYRSKESTEKSAETKLPVNHVFQMTATPGGAAQVAVICKKLGIGKVDLFGILGDDFAGRELLRSLKDAGVGTSHTLIQKTQWKTQVYHKWYIGNSENTRHDIGWDNKLSEETCTALLHSIEANLETYDCVLINQQVLSGIHNRNFVEGLSRIATQNKAGIHWLSDLRVDEDFFPSTVHKMNYSEAVAIATKLGLMYQSNEYTSTDICLLLADYWKKLVIITLGQDGAIASDGKDLFVEQGFHIIKEVDSVGAGDAFFAGMALAYCQQGSNTEVLRLGNLASGVFVQKDRYPSGVSVENMIDLYREADYRYNPQLAKDSRLAQYLSDTEIEIIDESYQKSRKQTYPRVAIFDLDGTVSTLREGWDAIMKNSMIAFIAGDAYKALSFNELERIKEKVLQLIEKTTGVQTIIQMVEMCYLIEEFGYVDKSNILTPHEYKELYAEQIRKLVRRKVSRFQSGQLSIEDLTIKNAVPFLKHLRSMGTMLYLASGTDQDDVKEELKAFGYDSLFNGGIYGSVGDTKNDPKRLVMQIISDRIEKENYDLHRGDCVVFGDGPVELREGRKHGFMTIGLVSDEKQRFGLNIKKRERLILAGADFLIPDYSWIPQLSRYIGWE